MNFTYNAAAGAHEGYCIIKSAEVKNTAKGLPYLDLVLSDATGDLVAKYWDYTPAGEPYKPGDIVKVRGTMQKYNGADQMRVERIRPVNAADSYKMEDLVKSAEYDGEAMFDELLRLAEGMEDEDLRKIVVYLLRENREKLLYWPAAFKLHHAMRGGLLYHTLSIVRMAEAVCRIYPNISRDLLLSGAMLHDIAKLTELEVNDAGVATGYSVEGNLIGHLAKGAIIVDRAARRLGVPEETAILLEHMLLSHHGDPEFGAAVRPMMLEAEVLSALDNLDAKIYEIAEAVSGAEIGGFTGRVWSLDNRKLFNHGMSPAEPRANLLPGGEE